MQLLSLSEVARQPAIGVSIALPASTGLVLERLRDYLHGFHPERADSQPLPLAFWHIEEDDLFMQALASLPLFMGEIADRDHALLPEAFQLAFPIFWMEEDFLFNGWAALGHAGEALLPRAIAAYARLGMDEEADSLTAALQVFRQRPRDEGAIAAAYRAVPKRFVDVKAKHDALRLFFRNNPALWLHAAAND